MTLFIIALCILLALTPMVHANSGPAAYEGTTAAGVHVDFEDCPIEVVHENLIFDVPEFPREYYEDESAFTDYQARVTAEYTLRNPTDADVTVELLFPFGIAPWYAPAGRILPEYCGITVDGGEIDLQLRHSKLRQLLSQLRRQKALMLIRKSREGEACEYHTAIQMSLLRRISGIRSVQAEI